MERLRVLVKEEQIVFSGDQRGIPVYKRKSTVSGMYPRKVGSM